MSFFKKLFGGQDSGGKDSRNKNNAQIATVTPAASEDYAGFTLVAVPYKVDGGYQLSGIISKEIDGAVKEYRFVRADQFSSQDEATQFTLRKGRQLVDEQGDKLFG